VTAGSAALLGVLASSWWFMLTAGCAFFSGRRPGGPLAPALSLAAVFVAGTTAALVEPAWVTPGTRVVAVAPTVGMLFWFAGRFQRQYQELARAGWERAEQLARERMLVAEQARLRERSRIAQDMHDALGHELSLLALSAGALKLAPDLRAGHREAAEEIRGRAERAVDRLGEVIGVLRAASEGAPTRPRDTSVRQLVDEASAAGLSVTARIEGYGDDADHDGLDEYGSSDSSPAQSLRAVRRVVQEALTNVVKHAPGAAVTVEVDEDGTGIQVAVENGPAPDDARHAEPEPSRVGGNGLIGLDERVRLAGGMFDSGPTAEGGFAVRATLPNAHTPSRLASAMAAGPQPRSEGRPAQEQQRTRRRMSRTAFVAVTACLSLGALLGGALTWWDILVTRRAVLSAEDFGRLRIGQQRKQIAHHLPREQTRHRPAPGTGSPQRTGTTCEYYAMTANPLDDRSGDVYRLCFRSQRLVSAEALRP
jgi:signal transduction histidine kinase